MCRRVSVCVCVYKRVFVSVCLLCVSVCVSVSASVSVSVSMSVYICIYICTCVHICVCPCIFLLTGVCNTLRCSTLQHSVTHCNALQHTATHSISCLHMSTYGVCICRKGQKRKVKGAPHAKATALHSRSAAVWCNLLQFDFAVCCSKAVKGAKHAKTALLSRKVNVAEHVKRKRGN